MNYQAFRDLYCHYLQESFQNFTCTNLSDSVEGISHDKLTRYLGTYPVDEKSLFEKLYPTMLWIYWTMPSVNVLLTKEC